MIIYRYEKLNLLNKHCIVLIYLQHYSTSKRVYNRVMHTRAIGIEDVVICVRVIFCKENKLHGADLKLIPHVELN